MGLYSFNVLSLCAGIGGLDLGLKLVSGHARTICYCEREVSCIEVLVKRIADGVLDDAPIWSDLTSFDGDLWREKVDIIIGGYPCQPFSSLGKKRGRQDERWLWEHIARIIEEIQPEWCFFENVPAHLRMGFEQVHDDLREMDYKVAAGLFTSSEVGAGHKRERLFWLAHSIGKRRQPSEGVHESLGQPQDSTEERQSEAGGSAHAAVDGGSFLGSGTKDRPEGDSMDMGFPPRPNCETWRDIHRGPRPTFEPGVFGEADGLASGMDRLRACGNAVVPLVAAYAFNTLKQSFEPA